MRIKKADQPKDGAKVAFVWAPGEFARAENRAPAGGRRRRGVLAGCALVSVLAVGAWALAAVSGSGPGGGQNQEVAAGRSTTSGWVSDSAIARTGATGSASASVPPTPSKTRAAIATAPPGVAAASSHGSALASADAVSTNAAAVTRATPTAFTPVTVTALPGTWTQCATEGGTCPVTQSSVIAYGANGYFAYTTASGATACEQSAIGNPGTTSGTMTCYAEPTPTTDAGAWPLCASENGSCGFSGVMTVAFGAAGHFTYATLGGGGTACTDAVFGDPDYNVAKDCYLISPPAQFTHWTSCAQTAGSCAFSGQQEIAYGAAGRYVYRNLANGTQCSAAAMGAVGSGAADLCYVQHY